MNDPTFGRRRVYLMRHGHVDYFGQTARTQGPEHVSLTPLGRDQAGAAAEALSKVDLDFSLCTGLRRTVETAEIVCGAQASPPRLLEDPELQEIKGGVYIESREELFARLTYAFDSADAPGAAFLESGETFTSFYDRCVQAFNRQLLSGDWRRGLVVAHEGVNRILLGWACGAGLKAVGNFDQDMACINVLDFDITPREVGEGAQIERCIIKAVNVTPYDYVKHGMTKTSLEALFDLEGEPHASSD